MTNEECIRELKKLNYWIDRQPSIVEDWIRTTDALDMAIEALKEKEQEEYPSFPCVIGASAEMYVDGRWIKGKIVKGYRFADGVVTIETADGKRYWCGQDRTDIYREVDNNEAG